MILTGVPGLRIPLSGSQFLRRVLQFSQSVLFQYPQQTAPIPIGGSAMFSRDDVSLGRVATAFATCGNVKLTFEACDGGALMPAS